MKRNKLALGLPHPGLSAKISYSFHHNYVGGVNNKKFWVTIKERQDVEDEWSIPAYVSATLVDALDPIVFRRHYPLP